VVENMMYDTAILMCRRLIVACRDMATQLISGPLKKLASDIFDLATAYFLLTTTAIALDIKAA